jgi:hypothetical protein
MPDRIAKKLCLERIDELRRRSFEAAQKRLSPDWGDPFYLDRSLIRLLRRGVSEQAVKAWRDRRAQLEDELWRSHLQIDWMARSSVSPVLMRALLALGVTGYLRRCELEPGGPFYAVAECYYTDAPCIDMIVPREWPRVPTPLVVVPKKQPLSRARAIKAMREGLAPEGVFPLLIDGEGHAWWIRMTPNGDYALESGDWAALLRTPAGPSQKAAKEEHA